MKDKAVEECMHYTNVYSSARDYHLMSNRPQTQHTKILHISAAKQEGIYLLKGKRAGKYINRLNGKNNSAGLWSKQKHIFNDGQENKLSSSVQCSIK